MMVAGWSRERQPELPTILGKRAILCAFSAVTPLLGPAGLAMEHPERFRQVCAQACLDAAPAQANPDLRVIERDLRGIADRVSAALQRDPEGAMIWDWLHSSDGGWGGGDPRGFWEDAIRWAGRSLPRVEDTALQAGITGFCLRIYQAMTDPDWRAKVDQALAHPYDPVDIAVSARQGYGLMDGAAAGGDVNQIGIILGPMRDWALIRHQWAATDAQTRQGLAGLGAVFWQDRTQKGWAEGSRIDGAWLAAPDNQIAQVLADV